MRNTGVERTWLFGKQWDTINLRCAPLTDLNMQRFFHPSDEGCTVAAKKSTYWAVKWRIPSIAIKLSRRDLLNTYLIPCLIWFCKKILRCCDVVFVRCMISRSFVRFWIFEIEINIYTCLLYTWWSCDVRRVSGDSGLCDIEEAWGTWKAPVSGSLVLLVRCLVDEDAFEVYMDLIAVLTSRFLEFSGVFEI